MNVAALLQDSPSEERRRPPPPPPPQHHQQQQQQQQQHQPQQRQDQAHTSPVDRDRIQPPPPLSSSSHPRHPHSSEYTSQHASHSTHLPPPSTIVQDLGGYESGYHRAGVGGGTRPLHPEPLPHNGHKLGGHSQRAESFNAIELRQVGAGLPSQRGPPPSSHPHSYGHGPPPSLYAPPPSAAGPGPADYPHHAGPPPPPRDRDARMPRSGAPSVQTLQLYPIRHNAPRYHSPPPISGPPSSSSYPVGNPAPVSMSVALNDPSPMYTGGPPGHSSGSGKPSSPAMGSLTLPRSRDAPPPTGPPRASHVQPVTVTHVTSSKTANVHGARTTTPHMEGGSGRYFGGVTEEMAFREREREREQRRDIEREREQRERERERDRRYGMVGLESERERDRERERELKQMEMKNEREFKDDGAMGHGHSLTSSPNRNGRKRDRDSEREREREKDRDREREKEMLRSDPRERDRERTMHAQHHPHHHHLLQHHPLSPRMSGAGRSMESSMLSSSVSHSHMTRLPPPDSNVTRPHTSHHVHTQPLAEPHSIPHTPQQQHVQPSPLHSRPQTHILDLSIPSYGVPSPPPSHSTIAHPPPSHTPSATQSNGLIPIPLILPPTQLVSRTPPPMASAPPGVVPLQVPAAPLAAEQSRQVPKPPPVPREIVHLGTHVYPSTPFPYRGHPLLDNLGNASSPTAFEAKPKELRAEILVPSLYLPDMQTNSEVAPGLKGNGKRRIWGGGISEEHAGTLGLTARIYTDDSDLFLCALHAGFITWSGARRARREGRDMKIVVRILRGSVSGGGGGVSLGRFLGGYGAECVVSGGGVGLDAADGEAGAGEEEEEEEVESFEDDGRSLVSAGWGNGHDGSAIEVISAEFVDKGTAHAKTYPNRSQRMREYAERRQDIFGSASAPSVVESESDSSSDRRVRTRKRRKLCRMLPKESASLSKTIVFGMGTSHCEPGFKYDPSMLKSILFPPEYKSKRRPLDELDDSSMEVDGEDASVAVGPKTSQSMRSVILETSNESFLLQPSTETDLETTTGGARDGPEKENFAPSSCVARQRQYVIALRKTGQDAFAPSDVASKSTPENGAKPVVVDNKAVPTDAPATAPPDSVLQILQRDVGEESIFFQDNGITIVTSTEDDGSRKGFMIEVKTWRWA